MEFRTNITVSKERNQIDYRSDTLLIGSCFSENIYNKLSYYKFNVSKNPFGILYNPKAIENFILNTINEKEYTESDIFHLNERWHCFDAHSDLSSVDKNVLLSSLNNAINKTHHQLKNASHVIITPGTSWVYRFIETDKHVGNCHKVPQKKFLKELCSVDEIVASLQAICTLLRAVNPHVNILFSVSPIRHLKDGFVENAQSKANLLAAIHQVVDPKKHRYYFPAYEIMMDDLRDYRFYTRDMLHPNETAIHYIWTQFQKAWIDDKTIPVMNEIESIQKGLAHKPFNPDSGQYQNFMKKIQLKIDNLKLNYDINF